MVTASSPFFACVQLERQAMLKHVTMCSKRISAPENIFFWESMPRWSRRPPPPLPHITLRFCAPSSHYFALRNLFEPPWKSRPAACRDWESCCTLFGVMCLAICQVNVNMRKVTAVCNFSLGFSRLLQQPQKSRFTPKGQRRATRV